MSTSSRTLVTGLMRGQEGITAVQSRGDVMNMIEGHLAYDTAYQEDCKLVCTAAEHREEIRTHSSLRVSSESLYFVLARSPSNPSLPHIFPSHLSITSFHLCHVITHWAETTTSTTAVCQKSRHKQAATMPPSLHSGRCICKPRKSWQVPPDFGRCCFPSSAHSVVSLRLLASPPHIYQIHYFHA